MVLATGSYVANDTLMKLVMEALPPYQVLLLRGAAATLWGLPVLLALGYGRKLPLMFEWRVLQRNLTEAVAVL
ncbi:EamA/RhaT family transporter, partial [Rhizobiaceae sp. 2RAB30]